MKTKRLLLVLLFVITTLVFIGCSSTPSEKDIKQDLMDYDGMELFDISKVTIDRELVDDKKDVIDCIVETSNEYANMKYYITIDYTKYDTGGWQIDDVQKTKDTEFEIISTPSDEDFISKCEEYIAKFDNVIEYQIDNPVVDTSTGTGNISAKATIEKTDNLTYFKTYNCNIIFEDGYWYTNGDEALSSTRYISLNSENLIGKSYYGGYDEYKILINIENISQSDDGYELDYSYAYESMYSDNNSVTGTNQIKLSFNYDDNLDVASYKGQLIVDGEFDDSNAVLDISDTLVQLRGVSDGYFVGGILNNVNKNDYSSLYSDEEVNTSSEAIEHINTEMYGEYRLDLNNEENGWCELSISEGSEAEPYIYIGAYENGNHETAFFEGFLFEDGDEFTSYCESTEADLELTISGSSLQISISNSIYDEDEIMNGTYIKQ